MIDKFSLLLSHGLLLLVAWRLLRRPDLDSEIADPEPDEVKAAWGKRDVP
ncbi:MAG: hypothetical protein KGL21_06650 [Alphaproteobacteria bacterium]|nr:hypothetical protein [Alphaproteobacteria bacterium]